MTRFITLLLLPLLLLAVVGMPPAAATHDPHETVTPQAAWKWTPDPKHPDQSKLRVTMRAPKHAWGIRLAARHINQNVDGIRIFAGRNARCRDRPRTRCVVVHVRSYGRTGWGGLAEHVSTNTRRIKLNRSSASPGLGRRYLGCHELGHVLGIMHHRRRGCVQSTHNPRPKVRYMSRIELNALRDHYNNL